MNRLAQCLPVVRTVLNRTQATKIWQQSFWLLLFYTTHSSSFAQSNLEFSAWYSLEDLKEVYPQTAQTLSNRSIFKLFLSGNKVFKIRLSASTETEGTREEHARQLATYGKLLNEFPIHFQVNFSPVDFLVREIAYPPERYSLDAWDELPASVVIRSDIFADGTFSSLRDSGHMLYGNFPSFRAFEDACINETRKSMESRRFDGNLLMQRAMMSFRRYAVFHNIGHEGVIPSSYRFEEDDSFQCKDFREQSISGSLTVDSSQIVRQINYNTAGYMGKRTFLLFYDRIHPKCSWFPSHILDVTERESRFKLRSIHTIHGAREFEGELGIPRNADELYGTNVKAELTWSNQVAYKKVDGQLVEQKRLSETRPQGKRPYVIGVLAVSGLALIVVVVSHFTRR